MKNYIASEMKQLLTETDALLIKLSVSSSLIPKEVLDALAAGVPVVAVDSDAAADLLGDGQGGTLTPEEAGWFARSAVELWEEPERRRAMAEAGRRIAARYGPDACAARLLGLYEELVRSYEAVPARACAASPKEAQTGEAIENAKRTTNN